MKKHTAGPWAVTEIVNDKSYGIGRGYWVAHIDIGPIRESRYGPAWPDATAEVKIAPCLGLDGQPINRDEIEATARLIAAAPDLLEACEHAMRECCDLQGTPAGNAIEAAIAKARGQG